MYSSLWSAKEFDSVGKYANLARDCAFLANIELKEMRKARSAGNDRAANEHWTEFKKFILWMAAASTGAILAIDQVKGNAVDPKLIAWLEAIADAVRNDRRMQVMYVDENGEERWKYAQPFKRKHGAVETRSSKTRKRRRKERFRFHADGNGGRTSANGRDSSCGDSEPNSRISPQCMFHAKRHNTHRNGKCQREQSGITR